MNLVASLFFSLFFLLNQGLPELREQYINASKSKENTEKFYTLISKYNNDNATFLAYKGAGITLMSKFASKTERKELFVQGVTMVEKAIKNEPNNAEARLIRLSIQENTPKILKYKSNIEEDKKILIETFNKQPKDLKEYIKKYCKQSNVFTTAEAQIILN
jgi:hypothetical protein